MMPYTHTDSREVDIKVHPNDVYTLIEVDGHEVMLNPEAAGELVDYIVKNCKIKKADNA